MSAQQKIKNLMAKGETDRDKVLILLGGAIGVSADELRYITLPQALKELDEIEKLVSTQENKQFIQWARKVVTAYAKKYEIPENKPLFRSLTYGGGLERTTVFKIIQKAAKQVFGDDSKGGIRLLQAINRTLCALWAWWVVDAVITTGYLPAERYQELVNLDDWPVRIADVLSTLPV